MKLCYLLYQCKAYASVSIRSVNKKKKKKNKAMLPILQ